MSSVSENRIWMRNQHSHARLHGIGKETIIRVQKGDVIGSGSRQSGVSGGREPAIVLPDQAHTWMTLDNRCRIVGGSVVDDNNFIHRPALMKTALNGFL